MKKFSDIIRFVRYDMWRTPPGKEAGLFDTLAPDSKNRSAVRPATKEEPQVLPAAPSKQISRVVVYYTDNTFVEFSNR